MRSNWLFATSLLASFPLAGQIDQINCTVTTVNVGPLNQLTCAKRVTVQLSCTGGTPTPLDQVVSGVTIEITANVLVAILPSVDYDGTLAIDDPAQVVPADADVDWGLSYDGAPLQGIGSPIDYGNGDVPNYFPGFADGAEGLYFTNIPFDPSPNGRTLTVQFWIDACDVFGDSEAPISSPSA